MTKTKTITKTKLMIAVLFLAAASLAASAGFGSFKKVASIAHEKEKEAKVAALETRELAKLQPQKTAILAEINKQLQKTTVLKSEFKTVNYLKSDVKLDATLKKYQELQVKIQSSRDPDELASALHEYDHEGGDLETALDREKARLEIPKLMNELVSKLEDVKKFPQSPLSAKDTKILEALLNKSTKESSELKKLSSKDRFDKSPERLKEFLNQNKKDLRALNSKLSLASKQHGDSQFQMLTSGVIGLNYNLLDLYQLILNPPSSLAESGVTSALRRRTINVPVLYIHWAGDPPEISNRSELDDGLAKISQAVRQFSYDAVDLRFEVCEVKGGSRPEGGYPSYAEAVRLCDPQIAYDDRDDPLFTMLFYPLGADGGKTFYSQHFDNTEEGEIISNTARVGGAFNANTALHELGHALFAGPIPIDINHAHSLECDEVTYGGTTCRQGNDYGDIFDTMGKYGHFNAVYKEKLGWLTTMEYNPGTTTYVLSAIETEGSALKIPIDNARTDGVFEDYRVNEPCDNLYVEYRKAIPGDYDEQLLTEYADLSLVSREGGVALHCGTTEAFEIRYHSDGSAFIGGGTHSWLLDCSPNSRSGVIRDMKDGLIKFGESCDLGPMGYRINFYGVSEDVAIVRIEPSVTAPRGESLAPEPPPPSCGSTETVCDGLDDDCNGQIDEGCDDDEDNYCDREMQLVGIPPTCTGGGNDCADAANTIYPDALGKCCVDSDGGVNLLEGGAAILYRSNGTSSSFSDACLDHNPTHILEAICAGGPQTGAGGIWGDGRGEQACPSGHVCVGPRATTSSPDGATSARCVPQP